MDKKWIGIVVLMILSASIAVGSGQGASGAGEAKPVSIVMRTLAHGMAAQAEQDLVNMFSEQYPDINVELIQGQWTQFYSQLRLAVMAEEAPQLATSAFQKMPEMYEYYTPLDKSPVGNLIKEAKIDPANFDEKGWQECAFKGNQYAIPGYYPGLLMWYNKDVFRKAGLDPMQFPDSRGPFFEAANKIKATGAYAFHPASDGPPRFWRRAWEVAFWQQGGEMFDSDYSKATFNNEEGLAALQFLVDVIHEYGWNVVGADGYKQFAAGELGIIYAGNWFFANAVASGTDWGAAQTPILFDKRSTWLNGEGLIIPKQKEGTSKEVYMAAMELARFYTENSHIYTMGAGHIGAHKAAMQKEELIEGEYWQKAGAKLAAMIAAGAVNFPVKHPRGSELESAIETNVELAVGAKISPQEALAMAEEECNNVLK